MLSLRPVPIRRFFMSDSDKKKRRAALVRHHGQKQRISAGACTVTPRTRSWRICSFAFRATRTAPVPAKRATRDRRETKTATRPIQRGAGSRNQQPHPFPPTFGFSGTAAKAGRSGSAKISRVPPAPQLHRGAIRAERLRFIFATGATGGLERRGH